MSTEVTDGCRTSLKSIAPQSARTRSTIATAQNTGFTSITSA